jgi:hypothetical protein
MERSIEEIIGDNEEISEHTEDTEDTEEEPTEEPVVSAAIQRPKQKDALEKKAQKSEAPTVPAAKQKNQIKKKL